MVKPEGLSRTSRLFVWSIVLDPMLFFVLADRSWVGVTFAVARVVQVVVMLRLALQRPTGFKTETAGWRRTYLSSPRFLWRYFATFFALAVLAGILGLATGAYRVPASAGFNLAESSFAQIINSPHFRPLVEYVIPVYFFLYFALLPRYIFTKPAHLTYFFDVFRTVLIYCLWIGFADIVLIKVFGLELLPRHLGDSVMVGPRFHGLAGEPRHAFAYLLLALAVLRAQAHFTATRVSRPLVFAISAAVIATQSASALIGLMCFGVMYFFNSIVTLRGRDLARVVGSLVLAGAVLITMSAQSTRLLAYLDSARTLWGALTENRAVTGNLQFQQSEIYPMYDLYTKVRDGNLVPVLLGSGMGSASAVNNRRVAVPMQELANPNSQIVRSLFESGLVGTAFFVLAFVAPISRLTSQLDPKARLVFVTMMLLVLGGTFGVRGTTPYIYLGVLAAMFKLAPPPREPH